jgi:hypothetical protein
LPPPSRERVLLQFLAGGREGGFSIVSVISDQKKLNSVYGKYCGHQSWLDHQIGW